MNADAHGRDPIPRTHRCVCYRLLRTPLYLLRSRALALSSPSMALNAALFAAHPTLSLTIGALLGAVLWKVLSYVRKRVALLAVRKIPGPPSESFWSGIPP